MSRMKSKGIVFKWNQSKLGKLNLSLMQSIIKELQIRITKWASITLRHQLLRLALFKDSMMLNSRKWDQVNDHWTRRYRMEQLKVLADFHNRLLRIWSNHSKALGYRRRIIIWKRSDNKVMAEEKQHKRVVFHLISALTKI